MTAEFWNVPDSVYYADSPNSTSNSDCDLFMQSPALYDGVINKKLPWRREATGPMLLGTAIHHALFATSPVKPIPDEVLKSNGQRRGKAWEEFEESKDQSVIYVTKDEYNVVTNVLCAVARDPVAKKLILEQTGIAKCEQPVRWECRETGLLRRCKLDRLLPDIIVDLKTYGRQLNAQSFANRVEEGGYYRQQACYQDAAEALGMGRLPFVFVVVQTEPPYSVKCFDLPKDWSERGRVEVTTTLRQIKMCRESGCWNEDGWGEVLTISQPRWATFKQEWEL